MDFHLKAVGFIGLGTMGLPMAINLVNKLPQDVTLHAYDISKEVLNELERTVSDGRVVSHNSASQVISSVDLVITIVPEGAHVRKVFLDEEHGIVAGNLQDKILIDCSTIDAATSSLVADEIQRRNKTASFYDAPVSGGSLGAKAGSLTFMVGCSMTDINWKLIQHVLGKMGTSIFPCGGPTMGLVAKLSNNYCSALIALATAEAMNIGMKAGMDPRVMAKIFAASTAQSTVCDKWCPVPGVVPTAPSSHGYKGGFKVQLMKKDLDLAVKAGETVGANMSLGKAGQSVYTEASNDAACRDLDSRVVFRYLGGNEDWASSFPK